MPETHIEEMTTTQETTTPGPPPRRFWRLVGEALWILLAVMLALAADQWRENRANAKLAKKALDGIISEIKHNRGMLVYFLPRHQAVQDSLPASVEDWDPPALESQENRFDPIIFKDTAWRTALETQALVHLDYQTVSTLTSVYTFQEAYADLTDELIRTSFDVDLHDPARLEAQFVMTRYFLFIFLANEQLLLETYDEALASLEAESAGTDQIKAAPALNAPTPPPE